MQMYLIPLTCAHKNGQDGKLFVYLPPPQQQKKSTGKMNAMEACY